MDPFSFPPVAAVLDLAYTAVEALATAFAPFAGTSSAAAAIAVTTVLVRAALLPLGISAARASAAMRRIAPQSTALTRRHRGDPERLRRELAALHQREGVSPFAGMLPMLAQLPVVAVVYALFTRTELGGHANALLSESIAGVPLGASLLGSAGVADTVPLLVVCVVLAVVLLIAAEWSRRLMRRTVVRPSAAPTIAGAGAPSVPGPSPEAMLRIMGVMPFLSLIAAAVVPLAAAVYIAISALWGAAERTVLLRRFP